MRFPITKYYKNYCFILDLEETNEDRSEVQSLKRAIKEKKNLNPASDRLQMAILKLRHQVIYGASTTPGLITAKFVNSKPFSLQSTEDASTEDSVAVERRSNGEMKSGAQESIVRKRSIPISNSLQDIPASYISPIEENEDWDKSRNKRQIMWQMDE